jgi:hypothetical protein
MRAMHNHTHSIGVIGTASRALGGLALLYLADPDGSSSWQLGRHEAFLGLVVFPAIMLGVGLVARRYARGPVRFTGPLELALNTGVIVTLVLIDYTASAAALSMERCCSSPHGGESRAAR